MVVAAAREICDGEVVFVGMRLPLLAFALAKSTHAPRAVGLFENGLVRDRRPGAGIYTMGDSPMIHAAAWATGLLDVMYELQSGRVDLGFIGGAEIDRFGNINTTAIGSADQPRVKLPGSGGGADIASLAGRLICIIEHDPRRLRERVDVLTSPGHGTGHAWRAEHGLTGGGPSAVITTLGVLRFEPPSHEAVLASYHPFSSVEDVRARTGWDLRVAHDVHPTPEPSTEELRVIRAADPNGYWTRPARAGC